MQHRIGLDDPHHTMHHLRTTTTTEARSIAKTRVVLSLVASAVAGAAHATDPSGSKPAASSFTAGCTKLAGEDLVLVLTPACVANLRTATGKRAFHGAV